jgi:protein-S-isoprenylcysteine O-methyltransferase Ste14
MPSPELRPNLPENYLARHAYLSGLGGLVIILLMGLLAAMSNALSDGWWFLSYQITGDANHSVLFVLAFCALGMLIIEMIIRYKKEGSIISISPKIKNRRIDVFIVECAVNYALDLAVIFIALFFFRHANEYGFAAGKPYYQPFFDLINIFFYLYVVYGFPYVALTRALQYNPEADRREPAYLMLKVLIRIFSRFGTLEFFRKYDLFDISTDGSAESFGSDDKKILLGVFVKMFFVPLMTVFFTEQFTHLVGNWSYILHLFFSSVNNVRFTMIDFYNVSFTVIFAIDVGLAWCGYAISTKWLKNTCVSVEPTLLGWLVAILCYPPFQHYLGIYFTIPSEKGFATIPYPWLVAVFAVLSIISYIVYMSATVVFGMRFSNLTHRGIITTGAYAFIRHPAYAAKNFSWWCVMMPYVIYQAVSQQSAVALVQILGLLGMTGLYYLRAITEERHLSIDPEYQEYCRRVRYRFIPGLF